MPDAFIWSQVSDERCDLAAFQLLAEPFVNRHVGEAAGGSASNKGRWTYLYRAVDSDGKTVAFLLRAKRDVATAKSFFRRAFKSQDRLPRAITLDGYQASHRAARDFVGEHRRGKRTKLRSSKFLNNLIEKDHRSVKLRLGPMLGFKRFRNASVTITGIELTQRIKKGQFKLGKVGVNRRTAPERWNAVLAA
jgi:transposase-like protein